MSIMTAGRVPNVAEGSLLLTVPETAQETRLSVAYVWELVGAGVIPSIKVGKSRRIPRKALEAWIASQTEEPIISR